MKHVLVFSLLMLAGCAAPTLAQKEANWRNFQSVTRATCKVGRYDPSMPSGVRSWCAEVMAQ